MAFRSYDKHTRRKNTGFLGKDPITFNGEARNSHGYEVNNESHYDKRDVGYWKREISQILQREGISTRDIVMNKQFGNYIMDYAQTRFFDEEADFQNRMKGYSHREINFNTRMNSKVVGLDGMPYVTETQFPVILVFDGHYIVEAHLFVKDIFNQPRIKVIEIPTTDKITLAV